MGGGGSFSTSSCSCSLPLLLHPSTALCALAGVTPVLFQSRQSDPRHVSPQPTAPLPPCGSAGPASPTNTPCSSAYWLWDGALTSTVTVTHKRLTLRPPLPAPRSGQKPASPLSLLDLFVLVAARREINAERLLHPPPCVPRVPCSRSPPRHTIFKLPSWRFNPPPPPPPNATEAHAHMQ